MKFVGIATALSALVIASPAPNADGWMWWKPPARIIKADLLGHSRADILKMGQSRWATLVFNASAEAKGRGEIVGGVDGYAVVYGVLLRERNDIAIRKLPKQAKFRQLERSLYRFGMAAIGMEDTIAGGGTYAIHEPRYMFVFEQETLGQLIGHPKATRVDHRLDFRRRLDYYATCREAPKGGLREAKVEAVHLWARRTRRYYDEALHTASDLGLEKAQPLQAFLYEYLVSYQLNRNAGPAKE